MYQALFKDAKDKHKLMHNTHLNRHPNIERTLKHTYLLCKPAGVGGEEALNVGCPQPPLAWLDGTD